MIQTADFKWNGENSDILHRIRDKLVFFEDVLPKLKEVMTILEIAPVLHFKHVLNLS